VLNHTEYPKRNIAVYPPLATSTGTLNEAPIATIAGIKTLLDDPAAIALDARGDIYVANQLGGPAVRHEPSDRGRITVYSAGSNGDVAPIATISGALTGLASPGGIALDSDANIYVANSYTANSTTYLPSITVYSASSTGDTLPVAIIAGDNTGLAYPQGIALDLQGNLYATGYVNSVNLVEPVRTAISRSIPQAATRPVRRSPRSLERTPNSGILRQLRWIPMTTSTSCMTTIPSPSTQRAAPAT